MVSVPAPPQAVIVGGGIAGLAGAIALARAGWRCTLLERDPLRQRSGHGLLLCPSGRAALERLGVEGIEAASAPVETFSLCHRDGSPLQSFPIPGSLGLRHRDLLTLLRRALPASVAVVEGHCVGLEAEGEDGYRAVDDAGRRWRADLLVAADGVGSTCRRALFPHARLTPERVTELVLSMSAPALVRELADCCRKFQDPAAGLALGLMPCRDGQLVVYAQFVTGRHPAPAPAEFLSFLQDRYGGWNPLLDGLLQELDPATAHLWRTTDLDPLPRLHRGNVVLVGDSAHPLLPFSSQGTPAALEDALRLAAILRGVDGRDGADLADALERYSETRGPELLPLLEEGRELRRRFLDPSAATPVAPLVGFAATPAEDR